MVKGLELFRKHFMVYAENYVLIGGAACEVLLDRAGLPFRVTRDLDIVLCVESLDAEFGNAFWDFVKAGGYKIQEKASGKKKFFRFRNPVNSGFPEMLELFSRQPDTFSMANESQLTPIPFNDEVSSLSAILLNNDYYAFIQNHKIQIDGLSLISPESMIILKAKAWLDLSGRRQRGEKVDARNIKKHKNDACRLFAVLSSTPPMPLPTNIRNDITDFLKHLESETVDFKALGLPFTMGEVISGLNKMFA